MVAAVAVCPVSDYMEDIDLDWPLCLVSPACTECSEREQPRLGQQQEVAAYNTPAVLAALTVFPQMGYMVYIHSG